MEEYLNICWHGYFKKTDANIVATFNKLLNFKVVKAVSCLICRFHKISIKMLDSINTKTLCLVILPHYKFVFDSTLPKPDPNVIFPKASDEVIEERKLKLDRVLGIVYDKVITQIKYIDCDDTCHAKYYGQDLIK